MGLVLLDVKEPDRPLIRPILPFDESNLKSVTCNADVIHVVNTEGNVYNCKLNISDALQEWKRPAGSMNHVIDDVASGRSHHVAITRERQLVIWGKNSKGQLGRGNLGKGKDGHNKHRNNFFNASLVPSIQHIEVLQVSCGNAHTVCLTRGNNVYAWGSNDCGQIGVEGIRVAEFYFVPKLVLEYSQDSEVQLSAGGSHTVVFDRWMKTVMCWGSNRFGQLGFGPENKKQTTPAGFPPGGFPQRQQIDPMSVQCGDNFTAFLTKDGKVFLCGVIKINSQDFTHNENYQLRQIIELRNVTISQISCGSNYLMAFDSNSRSVYLLGSERFFDLRVPECFTKPTFFCGKTFVAIFQPPHDIPKRKSIQTETHNGVLTFDQVMDKLNNGNISDKDKKTLLESTLSQVNSFNVIFTSRQTNSATRTNSNHEIDLDKAEQFFNEVRCHKYKGCVKKGVIKLLNDISQEKFIQRDSSLRVLLILPCCLTINTEPDYYNQGIVVLFTSLIQRLKWDKKEILSDWLETLPVHLFETYVWVFIKCLENVLKTMQRKALVVFNAEVQCSRPDSATERNCVKVLDMLHKINSKRRHPISHQCFYLHELENSIDINEDFFGWMEDKKNQKYDEANLAEGYWLMLLLFSFPFI